VSNIISNLVTKEKKISDCRKSNRTSLHI